MTPYEHKQNESRAEVVWNQTTVTPQMRAQAKSQKTMCVWFTGLSGSGKSTLANALDAELTRQGVHTMLLDGDNVRHGLCKDLGMTEMDRNENIRRVAELAKLMTDAGLVVITAFISPFSKDRQAARALFHDDQFFEVFVDTSLETCEQRDPKGLYKKVRMGLIKEFTGIDSPYEPPESPEWIIETDNDSVEVSTEKLFKHLISQVENN